MKISLRVRQYVNAAMVELTPAWYRPKWTDWHLEPGADESMVVFTAADPVYFKRFAPEFLSSLAKWHPSMSVHFHLYDPDQDCLEALSDWQKRLPSLRIGYSSEPLKPKHANRPWRGIHICNSRFLAAEELQRRCGRPILLMDVDVVFRDRIDGLFTGADYGLMPRFSSGMWYRRTLGGVVYVSNSEAGRLFLGHACHLMRKFLTLGIRWGAFDQYALYRSLRHMERHNPEARFQALTSAHVSFEPGGEAPIFYPKGRKRKAALPPAFGSTAIDSHGEADHA